MTTRISLPFTRVRRHAGVALLGLILLAAPLSALADGFTGGGQIGGDTYIYDAGPFPVVYDDTVYEYTIGTDGNAYYATYAGSWSDWSGWADQPVKYGYQPVAVVNGDAQYIFYWGEDKGLYHNGYDGQWWGWENLAGDYKFICAPYANVYGDQVFVYGVADDGKLYASWSGGGEWSDWVALNDGVPAAAKYEAYGVEWDGYNNVFWTGIDGYVYWNRYDGAAWSGPKQLPAADTNYDSAPYAIGYSGDGKLYAYANSTAGVPYQNVFTAGDSWSGWQQYQATPPTTAAYQPSAYEYDGKQHLVVTGTDGHAYYSAYDGTAGDWIDLGDNYAYDPAQYEYAGDAYLTYTGTTGYAYYKAYDGAAATESDY